MCYVLADRDLFRYDWRACTLEGPVHMEPALLSMYFELIACQCKCPD